MHPPFTYELTSRSPDSITNSTNHISEQATTSLKSICHSLSLRATSIDRNHKEQLLAASTIDQKVFQPLQFERLQFKSNDGLSSGTVVLGDRMAKFRRIVASEEKLLEGLYSDWMDVQKEITSIATEVLGAKGLELVLGGALKEGFVTKEQEELAEELEEVRQKFLDEVERVSAEAVEKVRLEEKVCPLLPLVCLKACGRVTDESTGC